MITSPAYTHSTTANTALKVDFVPKPEDELELLQSTVSLHAYAIKAIFKKIDKKIS